jgi:xanthine dehydrogenase accessory factor
MRLAIDDLNHFLRRQPRCVLVSIAGAKGSVPRGAGTFMLVSDKAAFRTIGGGQLEFMAIDKARQMLRAGDRQGHAGVALGPEIGQCCGGHVALSFQTLDQSGAEKLRMRARAEDASRPHVYVFGAGHVGHALAQALSLLPVRAILVDTRAAELAAAPAGVETRLAAMPEDEARRAPPRSAFLVLTHDHALDFLIVKEALGRGDAAYVGMIGSKSKRAAFAGWFRREGGDAGALALLRCPIGSALANDKRPEIIAALAAAEVISALFGAAKITGVEMPMALAASL